jgi:hypothetical protein
MGRIDETFEEYFSTTSGVHILYSFDSLVIGLTFSVTKPLPCLRDHPAMRLIEAIFATPSTFQLVNELSFPVWMGEANCQIESGETAQGPRFESHRLVLYYEPM